MPNINEPHFDQPRSEPGFIARRAFVGRQAGARHLGLSYWEVDPGQAAYPFHAHLTEEELVVVLEGSPSLRTVDGWREVEPGEVLCFRRGEQGAHQLVNRTGDVVKFLAFSPTGIPDIVLQPDSGKIGAFERRPDGGGLRIWFHRDDEREYYDGEKAPDA